MTKEVGFVDKVLSMAGLVRKGAIGPLPGDRVIWKTLRELLGTQGAILNKPYEQSIWVYSAVNAIATNIARVPFIIKRDIGAGLSKKIEEGPIYDLFLNPNPLMSQRQLFEATMIFLSLQGEAIWILEGRDNITQIPKEIWTFSPARFKPVQNKQGQVVGWNYDNGTPELIPFANHEIIFFRYFNPYDDIRGMPPVKAAQENINQDYYATKYNSAFFKNSAVVSGFITVEGELTDDQFNRTLKQFEDRHQGYEKAHKIALLEGGGKFTQATISQRDMEFIEGRKLTKQEILAAFKVNEVVLGDFSNIKCFHPDTEVFTKEGFRKVGNIEKGDMVASMDPATREASFELVSKVYTYDYEGIMYRQNKKGQRIAFCVTSEHKMLGKSSDFPGATNNVKSEFKLLSIKSIIDDGINFYVPRYANWGKVGKIIDFYDIGRRKFERGSYLNRNKQGRKSSVFPIVPFLKFLGWFISEGDFSTPTKKGGQRFVLGITQTKEKGIRRFKQDMEGFPYVIGEYHGVSKGVSRSSFTVCGKDLFCFLLEKVGHYCDQRRIPRDILNLHPSLLRYLFDALVAGDGSISKKTGMIRYLTTSRQLAEDVFELSIKLGYVPTLKERKNGKGRKIIWVVSASSAYAHHDGTIQRANVEEVLYKGKVHCIEVPPHHVVLARYNNRIMWIGQSYLGIKAADKAFWEEALMPKTHYIEDHLWAKFFSNIGQRRGKGKIWGEFDLATVGSLQVNYDDKIVTAGRMFTMGWPINAINRRLELGMEDVDWGDMWYVPGGYLPVNLLGKVKPASVPPELDEGKELLLEETEKPASSFYELEFRNKIKKFIFEVRKKVLSSIYEEDFTRPDVKKDFDKLISDLQKVYFVTISEAYLEASRQLQKEQKVDKCSPEVVTYVSMRIGVLTEGFAGLIEDLFDVLEGSTCDKEGKAEKVRMVFNAITQKSLILARKEAVQAADFGKSLFVQNSFGAAINYLKEG